MSQQINLFNPVFLKQKHYFSALTMVQALGLVLAGALAMYAFEVRQNRTLEGALADTEKQLTTQREQAVRFSREFSSQGASRTLVDELTRAEQRLEQREHLLADLKTGVGGNAEGFSGYLGALARQTMPGVWLTGLDIGAKDSALVIRGRALDSQMVPTYIRSLNREAPIAGRPIGELRMTAKGEPTPARAASSPASGSAPTQYIEFSLSIPLRGGS